VKKDRNRPRIVSQLIERQTTALETIALRLAAIDTKLERVANAIERDANPSTHPF
jgi:hypothetical protein